MKAGIRFAWLLVVLLFGACRAKEPVAAAPVRDAAAEQREQLFGPRASAPDVAWRSSGLGVRVLAAGEGKSPTMTDTVRVHYTGRLKDGTVFDDSRARGKPGDFVVNRLIPGWAAGMAALQPGGKAEFFVPPQLGYGGVQAAGVPPGSALIFEVELIAVNPPDAKPR